MVNLVLHCGARHVERRAIEQANTPASSPTWVPIAHSRLLEQVETTLTASGMTVANEAHALWNDGLRYFGLLEVTSGQPHDDYGLVIGLRNSHDKSFPAAIAMGSCVFVCDNLAFSAEVTIARRHTRFIERDLPGIVHTAVGRLADLRGQQDERIRNYKETELSDPTVHDLVIRAVDANVLPVTHVPTVLEEWRRPSHADFSAGGKTLWRFHNALTHVWKGRNLAALPRRSQALHGLLDAVCSLAV
jgi:Domain of unknown function (DUF932)